MYKQKKKLKIRNTCKAARGSAAIYCIKKVGGKDVGDE